MSNFGNEVHMRAGLQFDELMEEKDLCKMYCILEPRAPSRCGGRPWASNIATERVGEKEEQKRRGGVGERERIKNRKVVQRGAERK